jgi:hypothetical protein
MKTPFELLIESDEIKNTLMTSGKTLTGIKTSLTNTKRHTKNEANDTLLGPKSTETKEELDKNNLVPEIEVITNLDMEGQVLKNYCILRNYRQKKISINRRNQVGI